ncbi:hypothetical protein G6O67_001206 [Ophiocordyceps sinensis]|uniref:Uncharacterized protein n=1 Tax=Ophiocordyceps sinensis TaxID=72228 RepID=A0A8H4PWW5_9HYPO|nr:hypothetical protein G6O67_001206 [Ophiocordyceps sinensis]
MSKAYNALSLTTVLEQSTALAVEPWTGSRKSETGRLCNPFRRRSTQPGKCSMKISVFCNPRALEWGNEK